MTDFQVWKLREDIKKYDEYVQKCNHITPYYLSEYLIAEEAAEDGETLIFLYHCGEEMALCSGVMRHISGLSYLNDVGDFSDMVTPHEYSGILSNSGSKSVKRGLLREIRKYCEKNNIIFEFVRINPYMKELPDIYAEEGFTVIHSNKQVYVDLRQTPEQIVNGYKASVRRNIRRAEKEGLRFEIAKKNQDNTLIFQEMYENAMTILEARKFFYFNDVYFQKMIECSCSRLIFVHDREEHIVAAGVLLLEGDTAYYHLGCFKREYTLKRPMNYLIHSMILWSRNSGYKIFHLAGGGESLLRFKRGYSDTYVDYYIAYRICNQNQYKRICEDWERKFPEYVGETYYPLYRYNE